MPQVEAAQGGEWASGLNRQTFGRRTPRRILPIPPAASWDGQANSLV